VTKRDAGSTSGRQRQRLSLVAGVLAISILALVILAADADVAVRPLIVLAFLVLGPGLSVTGFLRFADPGTELAVAIPLSLALDALIAGIMSLVGQWEPNTALVVSAAFASGALALQLQQTVNGVGR
jgi:uncharacterized membrane protein YwaF